MNNFSDYLIQEILGPSSTALPTSPSLKRKADQISTSERENAITIEIPKALTSEQGSTKRIKLLPKEHSEQKPNSPVETTRIQVKLPPIESLINRQSPIQAQHLQIPPFQWNFQNHFADLFSSGSAYNAVNQNQFPYNIAALNAPVYNAVHNAPVYNVNNYNIGTFKDPMITPSFSTQPINRAFPFEEIATAQKVDLLEKASFIKPRPLPLDEAIIELIKEMGGKAPLQSMYKHFQENGFPDLKYKSFHRQCARLKRAKRLDSYLLGNYATYTLPNYRL